MHRLLTILRDLLIWLGERDLPADAIDTMSARERADLPVYHPLTDRGQFC